MATRIRRPAGTSPGRRHAAGRWWPLLAWLVLAPAQAAQWDGTLGWARRLVLGTTVSGVVRSVEVAPGDRVDKGQVLVRLDDRALRARAAAAAARLKAQRGHREEADRELSRAQELYDRTLLSDHELKLARIAFDSADADFQAARAAKAAADLALEYATLAAPFAGQVLAVPAAPGLAVVNRDHVTPLVELGAGREARLWVSAADLERLRAAPALKVQVQGKTYPGRLQQAGRTLRRSQGGIRYLVRVEVGGLPADLPDGLPVRVVAP